MLPSHCHSNAALLWKVAGGVIAIATGYALSKDGLWRRHSSGIDHGLVVETTEPRIRYFGFGFMEEEAGEFCSDSLGPDPDDFILMPGGRRGD
jgi:hypothetical protein